MARFRAFALAHGVLRLAPNREQPDPAAEDRHGCEQRLVGRAGVAGELPDRDGLEVAARLAELDPAPS